MELFIRIEIGNDAMLTTEHLVSALRGVANRMEDKGYLEDCELLDHPEKLPFVRGIQDYNGNSVGEWGFREKE
jgi:hypothetical protein